jgi:hypothetical protein
MNWFKNLNAMPRLMSSFGVLLVLTLGISYLAIDNLSKGNDRLGALYQEDMLGAMSVNDIAVERAMNGRSVRDAMLHIGQPAVVAENEKNSFAYIAKMQSDIETAEKGARSKESQDVLAVMRNELPGYEKGHRDVYLRIEAKDLAGAETALASVTEATCAREVRSEQFLLSNRTKHDDRRVPSIARIRNHLEHRHRPWVLRSLGTGRIRVGESCRWRPDSRARCAHKR